jgi:hypothetical protein
MRTIGTIIIVAFLMINFANAQDSLYIHKAGKIISRLSISGIDSITFSTNYNNTGISDSMKTLLRNGLKAYFPFNGNAIDESKNNNISKIYGATLTNDRFGNVSKAFNFDGIDNFIEITPDSIFSKVQDFTISIWAKNDGWVGRQAGDRQYIFDGHGGNKYDAGNYLREGFMLFYDRYTDSTTVNSGILFTTGGDQYIAKLAQRPITNYLSQWHNIVFLRKGDEVKTYIDNKLTNSKKKSAQILNMNHPLYIGTFCGNNPYYNVAGEKVNFMFRGEIDDLRIYDRAISEVEISAIYNLKE